MLCGLGLIVLSPLKSIFVWINPLLKRVAFFHLTLYWGKYSLKRHACLFFRYTRHFFQILKYRIELHEEFSYWNSSLSLTRAHTHSCTCCGHSLLKYVAVPKSLHLMFVSPFKVSCSPACPFEMEWKLILQSHALSSNLPFWNGEETNPFVRMLLCN